LDTRFKEKIAKIVIIDPVASSRQLITDALKEQGFEDITGISGVKEALDHLGVDIIDWIITPYTTDTDEGTTVLHLLKTICTNPILSQIRVSLFSQEEDKEIIPAAFELGLFSNHEKNYTKEFLGAEFKSLLALMDLNEQNSAHIAAEGIRKHYISTDNPAPLEQFETSLQNSFPQISRQLLNLGEAFFLNNKVEKGESCLWQARMMDGNLSMQIEELSKKYLENKAIKPPSEEGPSFDALQINTAVLIDTDGAVTKSIKEVLMQWGVKHVFCFSSPIDAWAHLEKNDEPDLIIHEWKMPKIPGPVFIQKVRKHGFHNAPIIIVSNLLEPEDIPLLNEMGVSNVCKKPVDVKKVLKVVAFTLQQSRHPTENKAKEREFKKFLEQGNLDEAKNIIAEYPVEDSSSEQNCILMKAEYAFAAHKYTAARDHALEHLKLAGEKLANLHLLGRSLMKLRDFETALKCLEKAQAFSPKNISRICKMAEAHIELGDEETAMNKLDEAKALDNESQSVKEVEAKIALTNGDEKKATQFMRELDSFDEVVAYTNNRAVAFSRTGKVSDAIQLYTKALESLPKDRHDVTAPIYYNRALARIRFDDLDGAVADLKSAAGESVINKKLIGKIKSLTKRLESALEKGTGFKLQAETAGKTGKAAPSPKEGEETPEVSEGELQANALQLEFDEAHATILSSMSVKRGDLCCYMILNLTGKHSESLQKTLDEIKPFILREAIERDETGGADKAAKAV
jgi:DNA-binding response OmpR family regulator